MTRFLLGQKVLTSFKNEVSSKIDNSSFLSAFGQSLFVLNLESLYFLIIKKN